MVNTDKHHVAMPRLYDLGDAPLHNLTCTTLKPREAQLRSRARRGNIRVSNQIKYIPFYCISSLLISIRQPKDFSIGPDVAWRTRQSEPKTRGRQPKPNSAQQRQSHTSKMEQPKLAITRMANRLRRKVVDMEEYLENHQAPLDPTQRKRIIHMNKDMRDQLNRIKQA